MTVIDRVRRSYCALHGHDNLLQVEKERLYLKCVSCEYETPGWQLARTPKQSQAEAHQRRLVRPQLVSERRVA